MCAGIIQLALYRICICFCLRFGGICCGSTRCVVAVITTYNSKHETGESNTYIAHKRKFTRKSKGMKPNRNEMEVFDFFGVSCEPQK
jgi:hypothetical protein